VGHAVYDWFMATRTACSSWSVVSGHRASWRWDCVPTGALGGDLRSRAQLILHKLDEYLGYSPPPLSERLIEGAQKIHQRRPILQETLATATQPRCES